MKNNYNVTYNEIRKKKVTTHNHFFQTKVKINLKKKLIEKCKLKREHIRGFMMKFVGFKV